MASASITRRRMRSGPRYVVRYRLGGRAYPIRHAGSFKREREAKDRLRFVSGELAAGRDPAVGLAELAVVSTPKTLLQRFDEFIASRHDVGGKTKGLYENAKNRLGEIGTRDPGTTTPADSASRTATSTSSEAEFGFREHERRAGQQVSAGYQCQPSSLTRSPKLCRSRIATGTGGCCSQV